MPEMIAVKVYWNTYPDGTAVNTEAVDWNTIDAPVSVYGPFESITDAVSWMDNDYPDNDTDTHDLIADLFDIPEHWDVNSPDLFRDGSSVDPEHPDVDIRTDDSQEIHVP